MPTEITFWSRLPVYPRISPLRTPLVKCLIWSSTWWISLTDGSLLCKVDFLPRDHVLDAFLQSLRFSQILEHFHCFGLRKLEHGPILGVSKSSSPRTSFKKFCRSFSLLTRAVMWDWPLGVCRVSLFTVECSHHVPDLSNSFFYLLLAYNTVCGVGWLGYW